MVTKERARQDPRFRPGQARACGGRWRSADGDADGLGDNPAGSRDGDRRLHVARAGERASRGLPVGSVLPGIGPPRDGDGKADVQARDGGADARGDYPRGGGADRGSESESPGSGSLDRGAVPGQGARAALRLVRGSGPGAGDGAGPCLGDRVPPNRLLSRRSARGCAGGGSPVGSRRCSRR